MSQAGFRLDLHRCVGCHACVLACRIENGRVEGAAWRRVLPLNLLRRPGGPTYTFSVACHHCDHPACLKGCPADAYEKRPDGVVLHHEGRCLGCRYCEMTCPFGTPVYDAGRGVVSKCHLCAPRLDEGQEPACVVACPTLALTFVPDVGKPPAEASPDAAVAIATVPGFSDPAGCGPNLAFRPPSGARRAALFTALCEALKP